MSQVAIFKQYDGTVSMLIPTQEMLDLGHTVTEIAARDIPKPLAVPQVASGSQSLIKAYDKPDANNQYVIRYNLVTSAWEQVKDGSNNPIAVTGTITHNFNFLIVTRSTLPSERFFSAWAIDSATLTSGTGSADHPPFFTS